MVLLYSTALIPVNFLSIRTLQYLWLSRLDQGGSYYNLSANKFMCYLVHKVPGGNSGPESG